MKSTETPFASSMHVPVLRSVRIAIFSLVTLSGCSDYSAPAPLGPSSTITEGTRVAGTVSPVLQVTSRDGSTKTAKLPQHAYAARFEDGAAVQFINPQPRTVAEGLPGLAPILAATVSSRGSNQKQAVFTDAAGRANRIIVYRDGSRILRTRHTIDGKLFAEINNEWKLRGGTWVLQETEVLTYVDGRQVRLSSGSMPLTLASLSDIGEVKSLTATTVNAAISWLGPQEAYASCFSATLNLAAASGAVAVTGTAVVFDAPALVVSLLWYAAAVADYAEQCG